METIHDTQLAKVTPGTITPISYAPPPSLSIEGAMEIAERFYAVHNFVPWAIGDLLLWAQNHLGEEYAQLYNSFPHTDPTLLRYLRLAEGYAPNQRKEGLSLGHHQAVLRMDHVEREAWLTLALHNRWGVRQMKEEIDAARRTQVKTVDEAEETVLPDEATHLLENLEHAIAARKDWEETDIITLNDTLHRVTVSVQIERLNPTVEVSHGPAVGHPE